MFMLLAGSFIHQTLDTNMYDTRGFYYRAVEVILVDVVTVVVVVVIIVVVIVTRISLIKASVSWSQKVIC